MTASRAASVEAAIAAGKHVYCEKPLAVDSATALRLARLGQGCGREARRRAGQAVSARHAQAQAAGGQRFLRTNFFGPRRVWLLGLRRRLAACAAALLELSQAKTAAASSWICSATGVTCWITPSAAVRAVQCLGGTAIPERVDEQGKRYQCTADDTAYGTFRTRRRNRCADQLLVGVSRVSRRAASALQVDGTLGSAIAGLRECRTQHRVNTPAPGLESGHRESIPLSRTMAGRTG